MRANFAADLDAALPCFANQTNASRRADVLAMNLMIAKLSEQNVSHHDRFLACGRPAWQTEERAPVTFIHDTVADEIVVLAMIEHRQTNHARILDRATHQFVVLNTMAVIGDRDHAGLA